MCTAQLAAIVALAVSGVALAAPVSRWSAEGNTLDSAGSNHGVAEGAVAYRERGLGLGFDLAGGAHVSVSDPVAGGLVPVGGFTVAAWFQEDVFGNNASFVNARPTSNSAGYTVESAFGTPNSILFAVFVGSGFRLLVVPGFFVGKPWHIVATYDAATGDLTVYRNGIFAGALDGEPGEMASTGVTDLLIGKNIVTGSAHDGMIDEVQVFDRALSALEALSLVRCLGDANGDGVVDFADLNIVLTDFGMSGEPGELQGDLDADGDCDFADLNIVLSVYGTTC